MEEALRTSVWLTSPEYSGWLMKRGFHWRKLWKKRWVAISGAELAYADSEPNPSDPGSKVVVKKCPITSAMIIDREDIDGNPNGFSVHINDGKSPPWYLRADSLRDKKSWLMRLGHVLTIVKWLDDFERVKVLGVGGTGIVYELLNKTNGRRFAMKEMEIKNAAQMRMALKEAEMLKDIMENISHPNIMQIEKVFQVGTKFYMVFPLCTGGELYDAITRRGHFTEGDAARLMRDLISGLHALHQHDILHLDIKPENLLFDTTGPDAKIKITDFGLSKVFSDAEARREEPTIEEIDERRRVFFETGLLHREQLRGTVGYMSPELILLGVQCKATDIWAAGVVLYILLCGFPPFYSKSNREVLEKSARGLYSMDSKDWECVSEEAKDLVRQMLTIDLSKRITATEILKHPFIANAVDELPLVDVEAVGATTVLPGSRRTQEVNLEGALRRLSDHVSSRRTEKVAMTLTKVMSTLRAGGGQGGEGRSHQRSSLLSLVTGPLTTKSAKDIEEEVFTIMTSSDARKAMGSIFQKLGTTGKLTLEQFSSVLKHFGVADGSSVSGVATDAGGTSTGQWLNMSGMLIAKFFDRDGDGLISTDDIFASQALILQRSEVFIRFVFRIYQEGVWYPGRQLNQMNWMAGMVGGGTGGTGSSKGTTTPSRTAVLSDGSTGLESVVEPPKVISCKNVAAIFDRLGFDPEVGMQLFCCLATAVTRRRGSTTSFASMGLLGSAGIGMTSTGSDPSSPESPLRNSVDIRTPNAALAAALYDDSSSDEEGGDQTQFDARPSVVKPATVPSLRVDTTEPSHASASSQFVTSPSPGKDKDSSHFLTNFGKANEATMASAKMDVDDFIMAAEFDDVLVQVLLLRNRMRVTQLFNSETTGGDAGLEAQTIILEKQLSAALEGCQVSASSTPSRFPIASAVGATLSAVAGAFGFGGSSGADSKDKDYS